MLERAKRLKALGLSVIPLNGKDPDSRVLPRGEDGKATWKPYQSAPPTDEELHAWFGNGTRRNIGVIATASSCVVVVDTDNPEAEAWAAANLPPTPMMTRTARGTHRYFLCMHDVPPTLKVDDLEIEVKRNGQYVVGPGSVHPGKPEAGIPPGHVYTEVEPWPESFDALPFLPLATFGQTAGKRVPTEPLPEVVGDGNRNNVLFREACRLRRMGWDYAEIVNALHGLNRERCTPTLDTGEVQTIAKSACRYSAAADTFPLTEAGDAEFFASLFGDQVRYDHRRGAWLLFHGHHWAPQTDGEVQRLALDAIRARQVAATRITDKDDRQTHLKWATAGEATKRQANLLRQAQSVKPIADAGDGWDSDPWLLGVGNGVVDLRTGRLRDGRPEDRITKVAPAAFAPDAPCPRWERFMREIFADHSEVADYIQRVIGYALTGETNEQVFWIFFGEGQNGKSTLMEVLMRGVFGRDYAWTMPFPSAGWSNAMSEYQKAELVGQRLVQASEVAQRGQLNEELIKSLTGGDTINARHPYGRPFAYEPVAKFFLRVNDKPVIRDQSHGMWRRVKLVPFTQVFRNPDRSLPATLMAEASGILAWAVRGCLDWQREGLRHPAVVESATNEYRAESDPLVQFFADRCVLADHAQVPAKALFDAYVSWCIDQQVGDLDRLNQKTFGLKIRERFTAVEGRTVTYRGLGLRQEVGNEF